MDLPKKIEDYLEELFADLGLTSLSEEKKADLYARVQEHLHRAIMETFKPVLDKGGVAKLDQALEQENYGYLSALIKNQAVIKPELDKKIEQEFEALKLIIAKEQEHAGEETN